MSLADRRMRDRTIGVLERAGWVIIPQPSTASLLRALDRVPEWPWLAPSLILLDARASSPAELAAGLRARGIAVPVVLATQTGELVQLVDAPADCPRLPDVVAALVHAPHATPTSAQDERRQLDDARSISPG